MQLTRCIKGREVNMLKVLVKEGPIFLLCVNYKIIAKIMGEIMKRVMHKVVLDDQIGFIPIWNINIENIIIFLARLHA